MKKILYLVILSIVLLFNVTKTSAYNDSELSIWKCCSLNKIVPSPNPAFLRCELSTVPLPQVTVYNSYMEPISNLSHFDTVIDKRFLDEFFLNTAVNLGQYGFNYYLMDDGSLFFEKPNEFKRWTKVENGNFCFDYIIDIDNQLKPSFWVLMDNEEQEQEYSPVLTAVMTGAMFVSCFFLFLVLVVYLILEEMRNLIGLTIMAYVFCFLNALLLLAIIRTTDFSRVICKVATYYIYFFLLASFSWMNVISYDIWSMSRTYTRTQPRSRQRKRVQFSKYAVYAFGIPCVLTTFMYVMNNVDMTHLPWFVTPGLETAPCFINGGQRFYYLYIPILLLIFCNTAFYVMTGLSLQKHYHDTTVLSRSGDRAIAKRQQQRLWMFVKLSVVMGVNWVFEVISSVVPNWGGWYITDAYNILIGVAMFIIFVCKKKTFHKLRIKLGFGSQYEVKGRKNRIDSYSLSSQEVSMLASPYPEGNSKKKFNTLSST